MPAKQEDTLLKELRKVNDEHGVDFKGPLPASVWSRDYIAYSGLFLKIRDISRTYFDKYPEGADGDALAVADKKLLVKELIDAAYQCRIERVNEEGWIREIEPRVLRRFGPEVVW